LFWITTGVFLFNAGEFSYNLLSIFFIGKNIDSTLSIFKSINHKLLLVLYSSFVVAFICEKTSILLNRDLKTM
jgi:hypothetical protein